MNKEEKAKEYIRKIFNCKDCIFYKDCMYGIGNNDVEEYNCRAQEEAESFKAGWDEALENQWVSVEDRLPKVGVKVLVLTAKGKILVTFRYIPKDIYGKILGDAEWNGSRDLGNSIIAWMPIPSFDKILEDNKDVLRRLKDK